MKCSHGCCGSTLPLCGCRPQTVAFNFKQWQLFFGTHDSTGVSSPVAKQLQAARQQAIVRRLVRHPHLLCVQVEQQVANLYEMSVLLGVQVCLCVCGGGGVQEDSVARVQALLALQVQE